MIIQFSEIDSELLTIHSAFLGQKFVMNSTDQLETHSRLELFQNKALESSFMKLRGEM